MSALGATRQGWVIFFITGSESKFHEGLPMDSLRLAIPRKVLNKIFNANAQNFISQDNKSEKYFCYSYNFNGRTKIRCGFFRTVTSLFC